MKFNIFQSNKDLEQLKTDNVNLLKQVADKENELANIQKQAEDLAESNLELGKEIEGLKVQLEEAKKSANKQAAETLASLGVPEGTVPAASTVAEPTVEDLVAQYNELQKTNPAEATRFYRQHSAAFLKPTKK